MSPSSQIPMTRGTGPGRLVSAWFLIFGASFFAARSLAGDGGGMARGVSRAAPAIALQLGALGIAVLAARAATRGRRDGVRNASWGFAPLVIQIALGALVAWLFFSR